MSVRLLAAALIGVAAGAVGVAAPAQAAACPAGSGVTVVVNSSVSCDADGGGRAANNFNDAGHALKYAARQPGFVCRVDNAPANDPCVDASPADAYWGLFWSDGTSGTWTYASLGVTSLKIPTGGWVAFVFQNSDSKTWPPMKPGGAAPPATTKPPTAAPTSTTKPKPKPTTTPTKKPSATSTQRGTAAAPTTGSVPTPSASVSTPTTSPSSTVTPGPTSSATPTSSPEPTDATIAATTPAAQESSGGSGWAPWLAGGAVLVVLGAAGVVVWRRRGA